MPRPPLIGGLRAAYAADVMATCGVKDERIERAFATVQREAFLPPPPFLVTAGEGYQPVESANPAEVYTDRLFALLPAKGINNGEPSLHARCLDAAKIAEGDRVLHIGCGSGYYTAIMAELAGASGSVDGYEAEPDLITMALAALADRDTVRIRPAAAETQALPEADVIYVSAGASHPHLTWLHALKPGGRLIAPLTGAKRRGGMLKVTRSPLGFAARFFSPAGFIPLRGRDERATEALDRALARKDGYRVRSLRLGAAPDNAASVWCAFSGCWLSTAEVGEPA